MTVYRDPGGAGEQGLRDLIDVVITAVTP